MEEVMRLAHRVSVLRSGRLVDTLPLGGTSADALLRLMAPETARELAHGA
jgi:ribose transport system ATP-binding protein